VVCRGKRDSQMRAIRELRKFIYLWHHARRRNSYTVRHDKQPVFARHDLKRRDQILKVQERLARSHPDKVCPVRRLNADAIDIVEHYNYLFDDLAGGQIPEQTKLRRQAKITLERTPGLRRKTYRIAILGRYKNRLDRVT